MSNFLTTVTFSVVFFILGDVFGLEGIEVAYHKIVGIF